MLIELFSLGVMAESLRAKRDRKSAISLQRGHFDPKFRVEGVEPHQSFLHDWLGHWMPYNSVADSFYTKKLCKKTFFKQIKQSATLRKNRRFCVFETPFGGLRGNVRGDDHLRLIGKRV